MRLVILLVLVLLLVVGGRGDPECPAKDNTKEGWAREFPDPCQDFSSDCSACEDKCHDADFSHWMEKNCAQTCGICTPAQSEIVVSSRNTGATICWTYGQGYADQDILESLIPYTTMKDCSDRCLAIPECGGAAVTEYFTLPKYCELAIAGASLTSKDKYFGGPRACFDDNQGDGCEDYWSSCDTYGGCCESSCPYLQRLMTSVCIQTCGFCADWTIIEGQKSKGNALHDDMDLEEAKAYCIEQGAACAGLSCKRNNNKCSAMDAVDDTKSKASFDIYQKYQSYIY